MNVAGIQSVIYTFLAGIWAIFQVWWWLILPLLAYIPAKHFYRWWIHWAVWYKEDNQFIMLEITPPSEVRKPFRAMEDVFTAMFWPLYDAPNWREVWCEGELDNGPFWISFEVASFAGDIHFYARIPIWFRKMFESFLQAHYPDVEIKDAEDYTQKVPQDVPNKHYKTYGEDYVFHRAEHAYPITTYKYFEIKPEEIEEDKRVDPFSALMEAMAKLQKGEQFWFQITINSIVREDSWAERGKELVEELSKRAKKQPPTPTIAGEAFRLMAYNKIPFEKVEEEEQGLMAPELRLTPGEKQTLAEVENKLSKHAFRTWVRAYYIAENDAYFSPHGKIVRAYFSHFTSQNLNTIRFLNETRPKIHYFFRRRRIYTRKRKMFRRYIYRLPPFFPNRNKGVMILSAEELTTIFHLPIKAALLPPGVPRISAKKGVPPPSMPGEE